MRKIFFILLVFPALAGLSQQTNVVDVTKQDVQAIGNRFYVVGSVPVNNTKYVKVVAGTAFFNGSWMKGKVILSKGAIYDSLTLRLDLIDNSIQYIAADGTEMIATTPVRSVTLRDSITGEEYQFANSAFIESSKSVEKGWYQVLMPGPVTLYKRILKTISESQPYGSATVEQTIYTTGEYYVFNNGSLTRIKKIKEIADLLSDKKDELNKYISSKNLSGKSDSDYTALMTYYNNLTGK